LSIAAILEVWVDRAVLAIQDNNLAIVVAVVISNFICSFYAFFFIFILAE